MKPQIKDFYNSYRVSIWAMVKTIIVVISVFFCTFVYDFLHFVINPPSPDSGKMFAISLALIGFIIMEIFVLFNYFEKEE